MHTNTINIRQQLIRAEALIDNNKKSLALPIFHALLPQKIDAPDHLYSMGVIAYRLDLFIHAANLLEQAVNKAPNKGLYYTTCGLAFSQCHQYPQAEKYLAKAAQMEPDNTDYLTNLGTFYRNTGHLQRAEEVFLRALAIKANAVDALYGLALLYERKLDNKNAKKYARQVLKTTPLHAASHLIICQIYRREKRLKEASIELKKLIHNHPRVAAAHYELGHIQHALKDYSEAKKSFDRANQIQDPGYLNEEQMDREFLSLTKTIDAIDPSTAEDNTITLEAPLSPVFILGSPRSGTTLLSSMLGQHSKLHPAGELNHIYDLYAQINQRIGQPNDEAKIVASLWASKDKERTQSLVAHYKNQLQRLLNVPAGSRVIDKTPFNVQRLPMIAKVTPRSPIIHIIRDGREVSWSNYTQNYKNYHWHAHSLKNGITTWQRNIAIARQCSSKFDLNYIEIHYEELIRSPRETLENLLKFLKLPWEEYCLENYKNNDAPILTASYDQVNKDLYTSSLKKAKNYPESYASMTVLAENTLKFLRYL